MIRYNLAISFFCALVFPACFSPQHVSTWKNISSLPSAYNKILVAAVIGGDNDSLRLEIEKQVAAELRTAGYYTVTASEAFGSDSLRMLSQEETFLSLCNNGIDAVLTIALMTDSCAVNLGEGNAKKYTALYYFNHVWSYHYACKTEGAAKLKWEMILFDVSQLQPRFILQTASSTAQQAKEKAGDFTGLALAKLLRAGVLLKTDTSYRKPF